MDFFSTSGRYRGKKLNVNASKKCSGRSEIRFHPECAASDSNLHRSAGGILHRQGLQEVPDSN